MKARRKTGKRKYPEWMGKMRGLTRKEIKEFLSGPVVARVATVKPEGTPYVTPVWQHYDGKAIYFIPPKAIGVCAIY